MLIDLPVTILFGCDGTNSSRTDAKVTLTLRYDTDPVARGTAQFTDGYPPPPNARWYEDSDGALLEHMTFRQEAAIRRRAEADPEAYAADVPANKRAA